MRSISTFNWWVLSIILLPLLGISQTQLGPGDLQFLSYRSDAPDGFSFVVWKSIAPGTSISFTDNGWAAGDSLGYSFTTESTLTWSYQGNQPLKAGSVMVVECGQLPCMVNRGQVSGAMNGLSSSGDQLFAFQGNLDSVHFIAAINFDANAWASDRFNANTSALPNELQGFAFHLDESDNGHYAGLRSGHQLSEYQNWVADTDNGWLTYDQPSLFVDADTTSFTIIPAMAAPQWSLPYFQLSTQGRHMGSMQWQWPNFNPMEQGEPALLLSLNTSFQPQDSAFPIAMGAGTQLFLIDTGQITFDFPLGQAIAAIPIKLFALHNYNGSPFYSLLIDTIWYPNQISEPLVPTAQSAPVFPHFKQRHDGTGTGFKWWFNQQQLYWEQANATMRWELYDFQGRCLAKGEIEEAQGSMGLPTSLKGMAWMSWWVKEEDTDEWIWQEQGKVLFTQP